MKIIGTGIDIVEIDRVKKLIGRNNRFLARIFTDREITYCKKKKKAYQHFAVRFAAKEAVLKALGEAKVGLKDIEVWNTRNGKPEVRIAEKTLGKNSRRRTVIPGKVKIIVTLSHSQHYAVAQALAYSHA